MAATTPEPEMGMKAPDFTLPGIDGASHALGELAGPNGTVIVFICNHCPYVQAITGRLNEDVAAMRAFGVETVAICSNDATAYPDDSFENMKRFAAERGFGFPYLHDRTQEVARAYGAVCTPDFFGFDAALQLRYRGRLDAHRLEAPPDGYEHELVEAMREIARTGQEPVRQRPSVGCSIKRKAA